MRLGQPHRNTVSCELCGARSIPTHNLKQHTNSKRCRARAWIRAWLDSFDPPYPEEHLLSMQRAILDILKLDCGTMRDRAEVENLFAYHNPQAAPDPDATIEAYTKVRSKMRDMALWVFDNVNPSPEATIAIRKLSEANMAINAAIAIRHLKPKED